MTEPKLCRKCQHSRFFETGSSLFWLCRKGEGMRSYYDVCSLPENLGNVEVEPLVNIDSLLNQHVTVLSCCGSVTGVLVACDKSGHNGLGNLILRKDESHIIVAKWMVIKAK